MVASDNGDAGRREGLLVRSARARQSFWVDKVETARAAGDHDAVVQAQRFVDEYDAFIASLQVGGQ